MIFASVWVYCEVATELDTRDISNGKRKGRIMFPYSMSGYKNCCDYHFDASLI